MEINQSYTMLETANILKMSKSIKLLVKMKNVPSILQKNPYGFWPTNLLHIMYNKSRTLPLAVELLLY